MELIDDDGDLFGVVNVVDALVILVVLAVGVAGVALVFGGDEPEPEPELDTTHATLDLGTQPGYIVDAVNEGDTYSPDDVSTLTVTDVHVTPRGNDVGVTLRVALEGEVAEETLTYANAPPRLGRSLDLVTDRYEVSGHVRAVGDGDALTRDSTRVVVRDTLPTSEADDVAAGDEVRIAGRTVATVEDVAVYATNDPDHRRVFLEATVDAHREGTDRRFAGVPVRRGQTVSLPTADYTVDGTISRVGERLDAGSAADRTVTLRMDDVREDMADAIEPGMVERAGDDEVARVTDVETRPSIIIATGEDGSVNVVDHPVDRDVTVTAELRVRETPSGPRFKGEALRQGSTVVLDLGTVTVEATVVSVGA